MPTAGAMSDGVLAFTLTQDESYRRQTGSFQITPRLTGAFRYTRVGGLGFGDTEEPTYDRSFDFHFRFVDEGDFRPAFALGVRDAIGTGNFGGEYIVATKTLAPGFQVTGGLGWGRLAERNGFSNPFGVLSSGLEERAARDEGDVGGRLLSQTWFTGEAAFFGGFSWEATDRLTVLAEYSTDLYSVDVERGIEGVTSPVNVGVQYALGSRGTLSAHYVRGNSVGVRYSFALDPHDPPHPAGLEGAPPDPGPRRGPSAAMRSVAEAEQRLAAALADQGLVLRGLTMQGNRAEARIINGRWGAEAQAFGRAIRVMAASLPAEIRHFDVVFLQGDLPITRLGVARNAIHDLEYDLEGDWRMLGRTELSDAYDSPVQEARAGTWPRSSLTARPYIATSLFDPDDPLLYDVGLQLSAHLRPVRGVSLSTVLRYPLISTLDDTSRPSTSVLPHVRSDFYRYTAESELELRQMTAEYLFRPGKDWFGRATAGLLEPMFGGVSAELLWHQVDSPLAWGGEINYARQRDFDMLFSFQDYEVMTGHLSGYYDFGKGYRGRVDLGRYLAGDWGTTLALSRRFGNGIEVGGFATLTDVPFHEFGEGSFDKGLTIEMPLSILTGQPSRQVLAPTIRPVLRDGGARLSVPNRLFDLVEPYRSDSIEAEWGRVFR